LFRLKILLDRALDALTSEDTTAILTGCGWHPQDYQRGYKLKVTTKYTVVHCKKKLAVFPSAAGMSLSKLSLAGNNFIIPEARESLVNDIPAGDRKTINLFLQCSRIEILFR
jgi:hypothetical protein